MQGVIRRKHRRAPGIPCGPPGKIIVDNPECLCYNTPVDESQRANIAQPVEQRFRKPQVKGSSPFIGSSRGVAQLGSASGSGPEGHRFKSCHLDFLFPCESREFRRFWSVYAPIMPQFLFFSMIRDVKESPKRTAFWQRFLFALKRLHGHNDPG